MSSLVVVDGKCWFELTTCNNRTHGENTVEKTKEWNNEYTEF